MGNGDKLASHGLQNASSAMRPHQQKILQAGKLRADQYIEALFGQVADKLGDALMSRSNKGGGDADSAAYMEADRELREKRKEIAHAFIEKFTQNYKARLNQPASAASLSKKGNGQGGGLSLVDEHELEESLAIDGLVARAKDRLRNELYVLAQRFNLLIDGAQYDEDSLPLGPETIGYAFRDVFRKMELKVEIKLIAYKLFEQSVMQSLGEFYLQINTQLSDAGILSEFKPSFPIRSAAGEAQARQSKGNENLTPDGFHGASSGGAQGASPSSGDVYQTLQHLMNARKYGAVSSDGPAAGMSGGAGGGGVAGPGMIMGSSLLADDLVRGLSLLQHDPLPVDPGGVINVAIIKDALLGQMKQIGDARGIDPVHDNTIDVIGMIFEFILDEPSIPDVVKALLNQLQIPIIKVAIVDKKFFTNKNHPARRLLNVLGHAGIGWNDHDEEARQRRFQKMEYIVHRVLGEYEQDPSIFAGLLGEFGEYLAKEGGDVDAEHEVPPNEQTQDARSDRLAFELIEARLEGADVPEIFRGFLRNTWRNVLQHVLDEEGHGSDAWRRHEQTLEALMWSVEPKTTADDRRRMVMLLPRLLSDLREGMVLVNCTQPEMDAVIDGLEPIHMACLRGEKHSVVQGRTEQVKAAEPPAESSSSDVTAMIRSIQEGVRQDDDPLISNGDDSLSDTAFDLDKDMVGMDSSLYQEDFGQSDFDSEASEPEDGFTTAAAEMDVGTWIELTVGDKKRRAKLAWKSAVMGEYVFVDRKYKVVAEKTLAELADDLRHGRAAVVEHVAMFDRALDKVLNGLMSGGAAH